MGSPRNILRFTTRRRSNFYLMNSPMHEYLLINIKLSCHIQVNNAWNDVMPIKFYIYLNIELLEASVEFLVSRYSWYHWPVKIRQHLLKVLLQGISLGIIYFILRYFQVCLVFYHTNVNNICLEVTYYDLYIQTKFLRHYIDFVCIYYLWFSPGKTYL